METLQIRALRPNEWAEIADLIHLSTNYWYQASGKPRIFSGDPAACELFPRVYEALDPGCCLVVESARTGHLVGSCFYHPRPTHISVGIVNVHPAYFGQGIARRMLEQVIALAQTANNPVRLVSSAMNLDSYSLYTRAGFVPRMAFQDMFLAVPATGLPGVDPAIRTATLEDLSAITALERTITGLDREKDFAHILKNPEGIWHISVLPAADSSGLEGYLASVADPGSNLLGPGAARTDSAAAALLRAELDHHRGRSPVFLLPVDRPALVAAAYAQGAKNCEVHFAQVLGEWTPPVGITMPTFMPE